HVLEDHAGRARAHRKAFNGTIESDAEIDVAVIAEALDRLAGMPVERPELVAVGEEDAVPVHDDATMAKASRPLAAGGIEAPQLATRGRVEREDAELWASRVQHAVDDDRIRLH